MYGKCTIYSNHVAMNDQMCCYRYRWLDCQGMNGYKSLWSEPLRVLIVIGCQIAPITDLSRLNLY